MSDEEKADSGVTEDLIRISVGIEHIDDIIADFEQSFAASKAAEPKLEENGENAKVTGNTNGEAKLSGAT